MRWWIIANCNLVSLVFYPSKSNEKVFERASWKLMIFLPRNQNLAFVAFIKFHVWKNRLQITEGWFPLKNAYFCDWIISIDGLKLGGIHYGLCIVITKRNPLNHQRSIRAMQYNIDECVGGWRFFCLTRNYSSDDQGWSTWTRQHCLLLSSSTKHLIPQWICDSGRILFNEWLFAWKKL